MSLQFKRHHRKRLMRNRRFHFGRDLSGHSAVLGSVVNTPKPCSCLFCGNGRKHLGKTLQERRIEVSTNEMINEYN